MKRQPFPLHDFHKM